MLIILRKDKLCAVVKCGWSASEVQMRSISMNERKQAWKKNKEKAIDFKGLFVVMLYRVVHGESV